MPLHEDEYAVRWCEALRRYSYPTVTFYFRHGQERRHEALVRGNKCSSRPWPS